MDEKELTEFIDEAEKAVSEIYSGCMEIFEKLAEIKTSPDDEEMLTCKRGLLMLLSSFPDFDFEGLKESIKRRSDT